jgi:hypothetical protein
MYRYKVTVDGELVHLGDDVERAIWLAGVNVLAKNGWGAAVWTDDHKLVLSVDKNGQVVAEAVAVAEVVATNE